MNKRVRESWPSIEKRWERFRCETSPSPEARETGMTTPRFRDRKEAGRLLAKKLRAYAALSDVLVLALPRGGVLVGFEVAKALHAPLDVFVVRKLGVPGEEELAMGAITTGGVRVLNRLVVEAFGITEDQIELVAAVEQRALQKRELRYRSGRAAPVIRERTVVLVDDGIATGATVRAALTALRKQQAARLIVAVPVSPLSTVQELAAEGEEVVCLRVTESFSAISDWYQDFAQIPEEEVCVLLEEAARECSPAGTR